MIKSLEKSQQREVESPYLTLEETAAYARSSICTAQPWLQAGQLNRCGHGRKILIQRRELEVLLSQPSDEAAT